MSRRSVIVRRLNSLRGSYTPNHFLLALGSDTPFISGPDDNPQVNMDFFHFFVHEYWHYWQNISTVSDFKSFAFAQHLLPPFSRTLLRNANGRSEGSIALDAETLVNVDSLVQLRHDLEGDEAPSDELARDLDVDYQVVEIYETPASLVYFKADAPNPLITLYFECVWPDGRTTRAQMELGSIAIEESVAFLVEEQVRKLRPQVPFNRLPAFPYRLVERTIQYITGGPTEPAIAAALGTMALLTTHPGSALVVLARRYHDALKAKHTPNEALRIVEQVHRASAGPIIELVLNNDLPELEEMHKGRGLIDTAVKLVGATMRRALTRRQRDSLFDLCTVFPRASEPALVALQREFPSCDLLQERADIPEVFPRDVVYALDRTPVDEQGHTSSIYTRSLQAQQDYVFAHVDGISRSFLPSEQCQSRCPYFSSCHLPLRRDHPEVCSETPWDAYNNPDGACWYATAVAATMGTVRFQTKKPGA